VSFVLEKQISLQKRHFHNERMTEFPHLINT